MKTLDFTSQLRGQHRTIHDPEVRMDSLAQVLERFNRKERNLLIRAILSDKKPPPPAPLSEGFCEKVKDALGFPIPADAWWGTDYHMSWLAGALAIFMKGEAALQDTYPNPVGRKQRQLVEGNQEDIDLVIATQNHLVLIEAKAFGTFGNAQIASKLDRLNLLHDFYQELASGSDRVVCFHLLLLSPKKPQRLEACWPSWACKDSKVPWIKLQLGWK